MASTGLILLEDDFALRSVIADALADAGYDVAEASSIDHARALAAGMDRPVLVADYWGLSQSELREEERSEIASLGRSVRLVLLTGRAWAGRARAADLGVAAIIPKPFDLDDLIDQVRDAAAD